VTAKSLCAEVDVGVTAGAHNIAEHSGRAYVLPIDIAGQFAGTAGGMLNTGFGVAGMISPIVLACSSSAPVAMNCRCSSRRGCCWAGALCSLKIDPTSKVQALPSADSKVRA